MSASPRSAGDFVHGKARHVRGDLEEYAARLAEIDRTEVVAILLRRGPDAIRRLELPHHGCLCRIVGRAKGDVMHRTGAGTSARETADLTQIDDAADLRVRRPEARDRTFAALFRKAKNVGKDLACRFGFRQQEGHAVNATDGEFGRNGTVAPGRLGFRARNRHQGQRHAVRSLKGRVRAPKRVATGHGSPHGDEALEPEAECGFRNAQCGFLGFARAEPARGDMRPGKESDDRARLPCASPK